MKKTPLLTLLVGLFSLTGCNETILSSSFVSSEDKSSVSDQTSTSEETSSSFRTSTESSSISSSETSSSEYIDEIKTVSQIKELCKNITTLNESNIGIDETKLYTIRVKVFDKLSLVKTVKSFGLNLSSPYKVICGDETGYIGVATSYSKDGNTFWGKIQNYEGSSTCFYEVKGYLSVYLGQPELYVPGNTYTYNPQLNINVDYESYIEKDLTISSYYEEAKKIQYNCAGHGYGNIYKIKDVKCYLKRDDSYFFTDGKTFFKTSKGMATFSVGYSYDLIGYISTANWTPCFVPLKATSSNKTIASLDVSNATQTTITNMKSLKASQDDTSSRFDTFVESFNVVYKSTVYVNYYLRDKTKFYITVSDAFHDNESKGVLESQITASLTYNMVNISNDNYFNEDASTITNYCDLYDYIAVNQTVDIYYFRYLCEYSSKKPMWKIIILTELL